MTKKTQLAYFLGTTVDKFQFRPPERRPCSVKVPVMSKFKNRSSCKRSHHDNSPRLDGCRFNREAIHRHLTVPNDSLLHSVEHFSARTNLRAWPFCTEQNPYFFWMCSHPRVTNSFQLEAFSEAAYTLRLGNPKFKSIFTSTFKSGNTAVIRVKCTQIYRIFLGFLKAFFYANALSRFRLFLDTLFNKLN